MNLVRPFILFPLTCAVAIHCYLGSVIPEAQHPPGPLGSISWGNRPFGGAETFSLSQAAHNGLGATAFIFVFRAADLCFSRRPPALNKDMMALHNSLQSSAKQDRNKEEKAVKVLDATSIAPSQVVANGLQHRKGSPPHHNPIDKTEAASERNTDTPLLRYLPSTRIPLEVDLGLSSRAFGWTTGAPYAPGTEPVNLLPPPHSKAFHSLQARRRQIIVSGIQFGLLSLLIADVVDSLLKMPFLWGPRANIGAPASLGGIREVGFKYEELEVWQRVALTVLIGGVVPSNTQGVFSLFVSMMLLPAYLFPTSTFIAHYTYADPSHWEPIRIFGRPWHPGSVRKLWGKEWHQMLTCIFKNTVIWPMEQVLDSIGCGVDLPPKVKSRSDITKGDEKSTSAILKSWRGRPGKKLRRALITLTVFLVSGLIHEGGFLAMARTPRERDFRRIIGRGEGVLIYNPQNKEGVLHDRGGRAVMFFFMQGVGVQGLLHRWIEGDLAKDVFELNVWSSSIVSIDVDYLEEYLQTGRGAVGVSVTTQVTLRNVIFHEDVGYGGKDNSRSHWSGTVVTQPSEASSTSRSRSGARLKIILLGPNGASRVKKDQAVRQMKGSPGELMFELRTADQTSAATSYKPA
ncbi:hypothetical protein CF327_g5669 [Tilletia walkeri]|nr:hypothetical protein CF327_g5669 [Tilletia walkeri]